jgi:hypothetical protein
MPTTQSGGAKAPSKLLITPIFRVSFPEVFRKRQFDETQVARYSLVGLFTPAEFSEKDKQRWSAIGQAVNKLCLEHIKKPYKEVRGMQNFRMPYHDGEEKPQYAGYGPGVKYFTMAATKNRPGVIDVNRQPITDEELFYPGCFARASVNPYWFDNKGKGIAIGLGNIQKLKEGERLDSFTRAEDDFGDDASEYGGLDDGEFDASGEFDDSDPTA